MDNIIIPVVNEDVISFVERLKKRKNLKLIIGVNENLKDKIKKSKSKNFVLRIFQNGSKKEEIINSLKEDIDEGKVIICRKPIEDVDFDNFLKSSADITICKLNRNKFQKFFFNLWQNFMQFLFGFEFFDGDISIVAFSEKNFGVIDNIENLSYASRINKWKGNIISSIEVSTAPVKKEYNKVRTNLMFYGWIALFLAVVVSAFVYFYFVRGTFLTGLLYACAILLAQTGLIISIAIFNLNVKAGQRVFNKAKEIK